MRWKAQVSIKMKKKFVSLNRPYKFSISVRIVKHKKDCISTGIFYFTVMFQKNDPDLGHVSPI